MSMDFTGPTHTPSPGHSWPDRRAERPTAASLPEPLVHCPGEVACVLNQWPITGVISCNSSHTTGSQGVEMRVALSLLLQVTHLQSATAYPQGLGLGGPDNSSFPGKDVSCREHSVVPLTWKLASPSGLSCCNMRPADRESIPLLPGVPTMVIKETLVRRPRQPGALWLEPRGFTGGPLRAPPFRNKGQKKTQHPV